MAAIARFEQQEKQTRRSHSTTACNQWRSQLEIMVPPCRAEGATPLGGFGGMPPRENFQM